MICSVDDCQNTAWARGLCEKHLYRLKRYGDPTVTMRQPPGEKLAFVIKAAATETDYCILHDFRVGGHGYLIVTYEGSGMLGHHVVLILQGRALPARGEETRHLCDNKRCLNGRHLAVGSAKDNAGDRVKYGKVPQGSARPNSKLTENDVRAIRAVPEFRGVNSALAAQYGVQRETIRGIRNGTRWKHVE